MFNLDKLQNLNEKKSLAYLERRHLLTHALQTRLQHVRYEV